MLRKRILIVLAGLVFALGLGAAGLGFSEEKKVVTKQCGKCCDVTEIEKEAAPSLPPVTDKDDTHRFGGG